MQWLFHNAYASN